MVEWLKFYFLSFFSNRISKEGATRSIGNFIASIFLAFAIVCCGMIAGYAATIDKHYDNSPTFKEFMYAAFADGESAVKLTVADGLLSADVPDVAGYINGFDDGACPYNQNGYTLVVDTRKDLAVEQKNKYNEYVSKSESHQYLILLNDACFCSFTTSSGISVEFAGDYSKFPSGEINGDLAGVDAFAGNLFDSSIATEAMVYFLSATRIAILYFGAVLVLALILYVIMKFLKSELCGTYTEMLKMIGSYLFISSVLAFVFTLVLSFFASSVLVFTMSGVAFIVIVAIRTAVLVIPDIIESVKNKNKEKAIDKKKDREKDV